MWDKIKAELATLFGSQSSNIIAGVKSAMLDEVNSLKASLATLTTEFELSKSNLESVKTDLSAKSTAFDQLNTSFNTLSTELNQACLAAKLELPETATPSERLSALQGAVSAAIAKTGINIAELPAPGPTSTKTHDFSHLTGLDRAIAANKAKHAAK